MHGTQTELVSNSVLENHVRQVIIRASNMSKDVRSLKLKNLLVDRLSERNKPLYIPVSYTHLDVYKRQARDL